MTSAGYQPQHLITCISIQINRTLITHLWTIDVNANRSCFFFCRAWVICSTLLYITNFIAIFATFQQRNNKSNSGMQHTPKHLHWLSLSNEAVGAVEITEHYCEIYITRASSSIRFQALQTKNRSHWNLHISILSISILSIHISTCKMNCFADAEVIVSNTMATRS